MSSLNKSSLLQSSDSIDAISGSDVFSNNFK